MTFAAMGAIPALKFLGHPPLWSSVRRAWVVSTIIGLDERKRNRRCIIRPVSPSMRSVVWFSGILQTISRSMYVHQCHFCSSYKAGRNSSEDSHRAANSYHLTYPHSHLPPKSRYNLTKSCVFLRSSPSSFLSPQHSQRLQPIYPLSKSPTIAYMMEGTTR